MSYVLGIDVETTGLDPETDHIIEVGAVLWDWMKKTPVMMISSLIHQPHVKIPKEITELTGITDNDCLMFGVPPAKVFYQVKLLANMQTSFLMMHNAKFDMSFISKWLKLDIPVIDTLVDLPLDPRFHKRKDLLSLSATHGFLNPFSHRAVFDVLTMLKIASHYDFEEILKRVNSPTVTLIADVSYSDKDMAKRAGFMWNPDKRNWFKTVKKIDVIDTVWDFPVFEREEISEHAT